MEITVHLKEVLLTQLSDENAQILQHATDACNSAYAPHSEFKVGAAAIMSDGRVITGSNQENAAYPSGLCAERTLLFYAGHQFPELTIKAVAITAQSALYAIPEPLCPCGACLQVMAEQVKRQGSDFPILIYSGTDRAFQAEGVKTFLPFQFALNKK